MKDKPKIFFKSTVFLSSIIFGFAISLLSRTIGLTLTLVVAVIALATAVGVSKILED